MFVFALKTKPAQAAAETDYAKIVQNTIDFQKDLAKCRTEAEKMSAVHRFLEQGGAHRDLSESKRKYSSVIFFNTAVALQVGEEKVLYRGSQLSKPITRQLDAGLYTFNYDTEKKALTLYSMNNPEDAVKISFAGRGGAFEQMDNIGQNIQVLFNGVKNVAALYDGNRGFAGFMEKANDAVFGKGFEVSTPANPYSASMQNKEALIAVKTAMSGFLTSNLKGKTLDSWKGMVDKIVNPVFSATPLQMDAIQRELRLEDTRNIDQFGIGFDVTSNGKICMNAFSYANVDSKTSYNPLIMYQVVDGKAPAFDNNFVGRGLITVDWDNLNVKGEQYFEDQLTKYYNQNVNPIPNIYAFASNVTMPVGELSKSFDKQYAEITRKK